MSPATRPCRRWLVHTLAAVATVLPAFSRAQAQAGSPTAPAAVSRQRLVFSGVVGLGSVVTSPNVTTGSTRASIQLAGVTVEVPLTTRVNVSVSAMAGAFVPGACEGDCAPAGGAGSLALLWLVTRLVSDWGIFVGPDVTHSRFGASTTGVGGVVSAGVRRGIGPRLSIRTHAMSGDETRRLTRVELGLVLTR